jgi:CRP/FNR family transcriptional regulator, cyclic AMP receptor protein
MDAIVPAGLMCATSPADQVVRATVPAPRLQGRQAHEETAMKQAASDPTLDMLGKIDIFSGLDTKQLKLIRQAGQEHHFSTGTEIVSIGGKDRRMYVVLEGHVEVFRGGSIVAHLGPGAYFGEISVIDSGDRTASVTATTDVGAFSINPLAFKALVREQPAMAWNLIQGLCSRVRAMSTSPTS